MQYVLSFIVVVIADLGLYTKRRTMTITIVCANESAVLMNLSQQFNKLHKCKNFIQFYHYMQCQYNYK